MIYSKGQVRPVSENRGEGVNAFIPAAKSLLVKDICTTTVSGSDVMVMCDPSTVRSHPTMLSDVEKGSSY